MTPLEALQKTLAAEHAAIHVLGTLGGVTSASATPRLHATIRARHELHRGRREQLMVMIRTAGGDPVVAEPAYALPETSTAKLVRTAGARVERTCTETYAALVAASSGTNREWAVLALTESATALLTWGEDAEAFPGAPELSPPESAPA